MSISSLAVRDPVADRSTGKIANRMHVSFLRVCVLIPGHLADFILARSFR